MLVASGTQGIKTKGRIKIETLFSGFVHSHFPVTWCEITQHTSGAQWEHGNRAAGLHDAADPGASLCVWKELLVPDHHGLIPEAAVPGRLAAAQVGGGRSRLQLLLLLLPYEQRRVPVPEPHESLGQGLLSQRGATGTRTKTGGGVYSMRVGVRHACAVRDPGTGSVTRETPRNSLAWPTLDLLGTRSTPVMSSHLQSPAGGLKDRSEPGKGSGVTESGLQNDNRSEGKVQFRHRSRSGSPLQPGTKNWSLMF